MLVGEPSTVVGLVAGPLPKPKVEDEVECAFV